MKLRMVALAAAAMALNGCVTEEGYRQQMSAWYGRMGDDLLIDWGNPQERSTLSDGRQVWTYNRSSIEEQAGYYRDETRQVKRTITDKDGKQREETITETFPVWVPPRTYASSCTTRFVMSPQQRILEVTFNGSACVAPEN
jgi:outer membrane lipoprotein-sorting protein